MGSGTYLFRKWDCPILHGQVRRTRLRIQVSRRSEFFSLFVWKRKHLISHSGCRSHKQRCWKVFRADQLRFQQKCSHRHRRSTGNPEKVCYRGNNTCTLSCSGSVPGLNIMETTYRVLITFRHFILEMTLNHVWNNVGLLSEPNTGKL